MPIDLAGIDAIDFHTHVVRSTSGARAGDDSAVAALDGLFGRKSLETVDEMAEYYRERRTAFVAFMVDELGSEPPVTNEEIFEAARRHDDIVIPFASVDPRRGPEGVELARRYLGEYGVRGFKFHPSFQQFMPNDPAAYPLYEVLAEHGAVALFHSGQTGVGKGQRAGGGIRLKYSQPLAVDDVAVDFPDLPIVLAHPSVPWQDEALAVALHKPTVFIDLSGWSPKYFPPQLVHYANSLISDKVLFGTDFPALTIEEWRAAFDELPLRDAVRRLILKDNAARLLKLDR